MSRLGITEVVIILVMLGAPVAIVGAVVYLTTRKRG